MTIKTISFVGMGALGILFGSYLTQKLGKEQVGFVVDDSRRKKYEDFGVSINGKPCDFRLITDQEKEKPVDLLFFAVKGDSLQKAMDTAKHQVGPNTIIVSLLNGIMSERIIGERFGKEKMLHTVAQGMDALKIGSALTYCNMGQLCVGTLEKDASNLDAVCQLFDQTGLPYTREENILQRLWSKFMLNVGVNQVVMIYEGTFQTIQEPGEARNLMIAAMREVMELSVAEGVPISEKELHAYLDLVDTLSPKGMPSMRQDGLKQIPSEVELFSGTVLASAKKHNLTMPVNEQLYQQISEIERFYS